MILAAAHDANDGFLITDPKQPDNPIIFVSRSFEQLTGYKEKEIIGKNCRFLQGKDTDPGTVAEIKSEIDLQTNSQKHVILNYRKDGTPFWNLLRITPIYNDKQELDFFVGVQTDISNIRQAREKYRQGQAELEHMSRLQQVNEINAGIFHQLKQPMAAVDNYISGCLQYLRQVNSEPVPVLTQGLEMAKQQIEQADHIIGYFLAYMKKQTLHNSVETVQCLIEQALELLDYAGIDIKISVVADESITVKVDKLQIVQVLLNILKNALEAVADLEAKDREIKISVQQKGKKAHIVITNNGPMISATLQRQIFVPFITTKDKGLGVGLALSKRIVQAHRGNISVTSNALSDTAFTITLPVQEN